MSVSVAILGCGWLGSALKAHLQADYKTLCITKEIEANIRHGAYRCDTCVIGIPPKGDHLAHLRQHLAQLSTQTHILFLSSISYYNGKEEVVRAERLLKHTFPDAVILRLGGLMGYDRIAGKYTAGKMLPANSMTRYIHRDDAVGIIERIIAVQLRGATLNLLAPIQRVKKSLYTHNARRFGFAQTHFLSEEVVHTPMPPSTLPKILNYRFKRPDVLTFW